MRRSILVTIMVLLFGVAAAQQAASTLVVGLSRLPTTLDTADANDGASIGVTRQITERLISFEPGTTTLAPGLATRWEGNEDSTSWTFTLVEGVAFHDGTPFNAEAVKFSFDRWNDADHPYHFGAEGKAYVGWRNLFGGFLDDGSALHEVVVIDDHTVRLDLNRSVAFLPALLAGGYFGFDSPTAVMAAGVDYGTPNVGSVGTGPYRFELWQEGSRLVLLANPDYRAGPPATEQIVFVGVADTTARLAQLKAGALDIALDLSPSDLVNIENDPNLEAVQSGIGLNVSYLAMHQANPPFDDVRVRAAVAHAIDRQAILDAFLVGQGAVAKDMLPPDLWGHVDGAGYDYDPERSRALLAEAGYPDGFTTELWYRNTASSGTPDPQAIAEVTASYLAEVGIQASIHTEDWAAYLQDYLAGKFPLYMLSWNADFADPDNFVYTFFGPMAVRRFGWDDPASVSLAEQGRQVPGQAEREAIYGQLLTTVQEEVPLLPLTHVANVLAVRKGVEGLVPNPLGGAPLLDTVYKTGQ